MQGSMDLGYITGKALAVMREVPLCDRCLGRLFARLGYGWTNKERGEAIKRLVIMELHRLAREDSEEAMKVLKDTAQNIGPLVEHLYNELFGSKPEYKECYICGGLLDRFIEEVPPKAIPLLKSFDVRRFIVGVRIDERVRRTEESIKLGHMLAYGESIKAEIRREIGKRIQLHGFAADFTDPEATVLVSFPSGEVDIQVSSLFIKGRYWKKGRMISQAYWPSPEGPRYFSVEEASWGLLKPLGGERVIVHAAGREDVDARMLGSGRPVLIEVKAPRRRRVELKALENEANAAGRGLVEFRLESFGRRRDIRYYKGDAAGSVKVYKALIAVEESITPDDVEMLERELHGRLISQWTPRRVLHRRANVLRRRRVLGLSCIQHSNNIIECLIKAEGGLYIKELVSGDEGRTTPSFTELLSRRAECVELDVVGVEVIHE
ncbi:MAG: tRNA pseudouridine(54/55) synthase Pus10 [Desulfurococcales archaeon]|nr:tRNA pseudouridine(54/55) synthase Pus10 [Desulfurococcales archaeon]